MRHPPLAGRLAAAAFALALPFAPQVAHARPAPPLPPSLLVNTSPAGMFVYDGLHVGGAVWRGTTSLLHSAFGTRLGATQSLLDLGEMLRYDALWVDQRYATAPSALELTNLTAYAATGRRVVVIGENATWGPWNAAILGAFGGGEGALQSYRGPGCQYGHANAVGSSALTAGVSTVNMACAGYAVGGTPLFDYAVASLWGPKDNVLTLLDANVFDDRFIGGDGARFRENVVAWVATPTAAAVAVAAPEPATIMLFGTGLLALGAVARRRRR